MPAGAPALLRFGLAQLGCYWLTTHCRGCADTALRYLAGFCPANLLATLAAVRPTAWHTLKAAGIDLATDFYWIDDYLLAAEKPGVTPS